MKTKVCISLMILFVLVCGMFLPGFGGRPVGAQADLHVTESGGSLTCDDWTNSCTLAHALTLAAGGGYSEIWVAAGIHKPSTAGDRTATYQLVSGVEIYGGFAGVPGTEGDFGARDWVAHPTVLSGDIGVLGNPNDNSYHVVTGSSTDNTAVLDGFTIRGGNSDSVFPNSIGGGMYNDAGSPTVRNVIFDSNYALEGGGGMANWINSDPLISGVLFAGNSSAQGGGMYNNDSNPSLSACSFVGNSAGDGGGGMANRNGSDPTLTRVTFDGNSAQYGGGVLNNVGNPTMMEVAFVANSATQQGGGLWNGGGSGGPITNATFYGNTATSLGGGVYSQATSPPLTNVIFAGNEAANGGGMANFSGGNLTLVNVTFAANSASLGGGMYNLGGSNPALANCILWGNTADSGVQIFNDNTSEPTIGYSDIQGSDDTGSWDINLGTDLGGNIDSDPVFARPPGPGVDGIWGTSDDDYGDLHQPLTSPVIDAGDNNAVPGGVTYDLVHGLRFVDIVTVADAGAGTPPIVDMGAYEARPTGPYDVNDLGDLADHYPGDGNCDVDAGLTGNQCTLRAALQEWRQAGVDDSITFSASGTIDLTGDLPAFTSTKTLQILGPGPESLTINGDNGNYRPFSLGPPSLVISGMTLEEAGGSYGGAIHNLGTLTLDDMVIRDSVATMNGGAIFNFSSGNLSIRNVILDSNEAGGTGGGIQNEGTLSIFDSIIRSNFSSGDGGGLYNASGSNAELTNVVLSANSGAMGGAIGNQGSSPILTNVTIFQNWGHEGSGIYSADSSHPTVRNSMLWYNTDGAGNEQIEYSADSSTTVTYSSVQHGYPGSGNISAAPLFVDAYGPDTWPGTEDDDLRLLPSSPGVDAGDNNALPGIIITDLGGSPRFVDISAVPDTGVGPPPVVDMGAYEAAGAPPPMIYVDIDATGANDGTSWVNALTDLQDALNWAGAGTEIWVAEGTYGPTTVVDQSASFRLASGVGIYGGFEGTETLLEERDWVDNETILSGNFGATVDCTDSSYHVVNGSGTDASTVLDGFTISGGCTGVGHDSDGGGVLNDAGSPTIRHVIIRDNHSHLHGGGMANLNGSAPALVDVLFADNRAFGDGGGLWNNSSNPTLLDVVISGNSCNYMGGGMHNRDSSPTLTHVSFAANDAGLGAGGGMSTVGTSHAVLTDVEFVDNNVSAAHGGGLALSGGSASLTGVTFRNNRTDTGSGGAMLLSGTSAALTDVTFHENHADAGGGGAIYQFSGSLSADGCSFEGNTARRGGAIYTEDGDSTVTGSLLERNTSFEEGGSVYVNSAGTVLLQACTLSENHAGTGGGVYNTGGLTLVNSSISGNLADEDGGGIAELGTATTSLHNVTISGNRADADLDGFGDGGGLFSSWGSVSLQNTIVAGNFLADSLLLPSDCFAEGSSEFPLTNHNLIGDETGCAGIFAGADGNLVGSDPLLGRLADNGGPNLTHALLADSPARDAGDDVAGCLDHTGNPLTVDQRGMERPRQGSEAGVGGTPVCDMGAFEAGLANDSWPRAQRLTLAGDPSSATTEEYIDKLGQSRWYKFEVIPGSRVSVELTNLPADYDMILYKDIAAAYRDLFSEEDLVHLDAEFAPDMFSPDMFSPDMFSPDMFSPDMFSPDMFSPDMFSPDMFSPDMFSPDMFSPDMFSPDMFSPDMFSPDMFSPDMFSPDMFSPDMFSPDPTAFASVQLRSMVAVSAFDGTAGEVVTVNTWDNSGNFYIRVRGRNGAFDLSAPFHLQVTQEEGICEGVTAGVGGAELAPAGGSYETLILTDWDRFEAGPDLAALQAALPSFASSVGGVVVDVGEGGGTYIDNLNAQADTHTGCPYGKNLVARAVKELVDGYQELNPDLQYIVILGGDDVVPFFRHPDRALLANEKNYEPPVGSDSASYASLNLGYILSQDAYGSSVDLSLSNTTLPVPDLAVGRLVETPAEILRMLEAYGNTASGLVPTPQSALVTGYDFLADAASEVQVQLGEGLGAAGTIDSLISPAHISPQDREGIPPDDAAWPADMLGDLLLDNDHDLIFLAGHFSAHSSLAADYETRLLASDLVASPVDLENALVFSAGCHSGYSLVNEHGVPNLTIHPDWAQAFAQKGATLVAGTGYQYGDTDFVEYSERLYLEFSKQFRYGFDPVPVGKALVAAKQAYLAGTAEMRGIHEKALLEATLFGLPMISVDLPAGRYDPTVPDSIVEAVTTFGSDPGAELALQYADEPISFSLTLHTKTLNSTDDTMEVTYLSSADGVVTNPVEPVLPLEKINASYPGTVLRGVGFRAGSYADLPGIAPLTGAATTEVRGVHPPFQSEVFFPVRPWRVNYFDRLANGAGGVTWLDVTPAQFLSTSPAPWYGTLRQYDAMDFRFYYSAETGSYTQADGTVNVPALAAPPAIVKVLATPGPDEVTFQATVLGNPSAGIQEVWVTYTTCDGTSACAGIWTSLDLVQNAEDTTQWAETLSLGSMPAGDLHYIVQAVSGVGLVTMATNMGEYFRVGVDPADPSASGDAATPPTPTALALQSPPTQGAYSTDVAFSALLQTSGGTPIAGQQVKFALGAQQRWAVTDEFGIAAVTIPLLSTPGNYSVRASFAGNADYAPFSDAGSLTIVKQDIAISFVDDPGVAQYSDDALMAAELRDANGRTMREMTVLFVISGGGYSYNTAEITDLVSQASPSRIPLPPGSYQIVAHFGDDVPANGYVDLTDLNYSAALPAVGTLNMIPEDVAVTYTGQTLVPDADTTLDLAAQVAQADDGAPGDLTLAQVHYEVFDADGGYVGTANAGVLGDGGSTASIPVTSPGTYQVHITVIGDYFATGLASQVDNLSLPLVPVELGTAIEAVAHFADSDSGSDHAAVWNWGDGNSCDTSAAGALCTLTEPAGGDPGEVTGNHTYTEPGVYTVRLTITDDDGLTGEATFEYVVVYDPSAGFVSGGGWIDSPEGACPVFCEGATGKASFGFVSKYKKGADVPSGQTVFEFKAGDLSFHSDSYDWLVVAGPKAKFKGTGTINGTGNYGFMISAIDAALTPSTDVDLFRIKIWDREGDEAVIYDNQMEEADDADPATAIGGGSIVIHKKK